MRNLENTPKIVPVAGKAFKNNQQILSLSESFGSILGGTGVALDTFENIFFENLLGFLIFTLCSRPCCLQLMSKPAVFGLGEGLAKYLDMPVSGLDHLVPLLRVPFGEDDAALMRGSCADNTRT